MAKLNRTQRRTASIFLQRARKRRATPMETEALIEAGLVEANLLNPGGGDRDSVGSLQERSHYGSRSRRLNRGAAADRFLREARTIKRRGFKGSSGDLAQAVQRSAFPDRYEARDAEAEQIIGSLGGGRQTRSGGGSRLREAVAEKASRLELPEPVVTPQPTASPIVSAQLAGVDLGPHNPPVSPTPAVETPMPARKITLPGSEPTGDAPAATPRRRGRARRGRGEGLVKGGGKVIGTPHSGTHTLGDWQSDNAIDIAIPVGTPIYAPRDGHVAKTKIKKSMAGRFGGSQVTLEGGGNGYFYAHLSRVAVKPGQRVRKGDVIGYSGEANGVEHLHFGQRRGDPRKRKR